jgi:hypothetical protein
MSEGRNFKNPAEKRRRLAGGKSRDTGAMKVLHRRLRGTVERLSTSNEDAASSGRLSRPGCDFIPKTSGNVGTGQCRRGLEEQMTKRAAIPGVIGAGLLLATAAFADPYNPGERAITGGLLGAGTGAVIGAIAGGGHGAGIGAAVGGGLGAVTGAATTPARPRHVYRHHYYNAHRSY